MDQETRKLVTRVVGGVAGGVVLASGLALYAKYSDKELDVGVLFLAFLFGWALQVSGWIWGEVLEKWASAYRALQEGRSYRANGQMRAARLAAEARDLALGDISDSREDEAPGEVEWSHPLDDGSGHARIVETVIPAQEAAWRQAMINFLRWADEYGGLESKRLVGASLAVRSPNDWVTMTSALAGAGFVYKVSGQPTRLAGDWTYESAIDDLVGLRYIALPKVPPPNVRTWAPPPAPPHNPPAPGWSEA